MDHVSIKPTIKTLQAKHSKRGPYIVHVGNVHDNVLQHQLTVTLIRTQNLIQMWCKPDIVEYCRQALIGTTAQKVPSFLSDSCSELKLMLASPPSQRIQDY